MSFQYRKFPHFFLGLFQKISHESPFLLPSNYHYSRGLFLKLQFSSVQSLSRVQLFATPWTAAQQASLPITNSLPEFTQTHVHWVGDAIQPSHPLSSPSPPTFNLSQHQGLLQWVSSSHQVAKVLEFQLQHQSFQWTLRTVRISLQSKGLSRVFSNTTDQKHQFLGTQLSL